MKQLREFIYDKSDILVALVILLIAALVIFWRLPIILQRSLTMITSNLQASLRKSIRPKMKLKIMKKHPKKIVPIPRQKITRKTRQIFTVMV